MIGLFSSCALGAAVGAQHALEPDHLAAVSTIVADHPRRAAWMGAIWGLGHAAALLVVGCALIIARTELPETGVAALELAVAGMLNVLGARNLWRAGQSGGPVLLHRHGGHTHAHAADDQGHIHVVGRAFSIRPLVIGLIHGLAGSGGLAALAAARMPSTATALAYIALFGAGSVAGMALVSGAFGATLGRLLRGRARLLVAATGAVSVACGIAWAWTQLTLLL
jgi:hypothetical protein